MTSDKQCHEFWNLISHMLDSISIYAPEMYIENSGAKNRNEFRKQLTQSSFVVVLTEICAMVAYSRIKEAHDGRKQAERETRRIRRRIKSEKRI